MEQSFITNSHITPPCVLLITLIYIISRKCELFNTEQPSHRIFLWEGLFFAKASIKKLPALVVAAALFGGLVCLAGAEDFLEGFLCSLILWTVIKLYVTLVLNCGWFAHCKMAWIPGTQDMQNSYQNYGFYLKSIPRSLLFGAVVSAAIGIFIEIIK